MVGIDTRGSSRIVAVVGLLALLFAMLAPALLTIRTAEASIPTSVTVYAGTVPAGPVTAPPAAAPGGIPNSSAGGTFRVAANVNDTDALPHLTNETNVSMTTSRGTFTDSGTTSVIIPCAIDGAATPATATVDIDGAGPAPTLTFTDPTYLAGIAVENEAEADVAPAIGTKPPDPGESQPEEGITPALAIAGTSAGDEGCLAVDAFVQFTSQTTGTTAVSATAQNGGAAGSTTVFINQFSGTPATLTVTNVEGARYIAPSITGRFTSPNPEATVVASLRDAAGNPVIQNTILWTTSNGTVDISTSPPSPPAAAGVPATIAPACAGTANNGAELTDAQGNSQVYFCARPGNALGDATITATEPTSGRTASVTVTFVGPPARVTMTTEVIAGTTGTTALESSQAAVGPAVSIRAIVECRDADNRPCADGTGLALAASGAGTVVSAVTAFTNGRATGIVTTNAEQNASVAITASVATTDGNVVADARTVNLRQSTPTATGTGTAGPTGTATATPSLSVTPNSPYTSGLNAVVVQGTGTAAQVATVISTASGRTVLVIFVLAGGNWLYFLPAFPAINGGLTNFPGPLASAIVTLQ